MDSELDRGNGIPYEGNYSAWLEQKQKRLEQESRDEALVNARWRANWSGSGSRQRPVMPRARRVSRRMKTCLPEKRQQGTGNMPDCDPDAASPRPSRC